MGNLPGKKVQNSFGRAENVTININETDRILEFFNETGKSFFKQTNVKKLSECPLSGVEQTFSRKKYITKAPADLTKGPLDMFSWLFSHFFNRY